MKRRRQLPALSFLTSYRSPVQQAHWRCRQIMRCKRRTVTAVVAAVAGSTEPSGKLASQGRYSILDTKSDKSSERERRCSSNSRKLFDSSSHRGRHSSREALAVIDPVKAYYRMGMDYRSLHLFNRLQQRRSDGVIKFIRNLAGAAINARPCLSRSSQAR